jgi:hypothetical protein
MKTTEEGHSVPKKKTLGISNMMASNKRGKGRGSVYPRGTKWVGVLPVHARPPHQITADSEDEANEMLDEILAGITAHTIYLPKELGEDVTAKATENDTTLSRVVEPMLEAWVKEDQ